MENEKKKKKSLLIYVLIVLGIGIFVAAIFLAPDKEQEFFDSLAEEQRKNTPEIMSTAGKYGELGELNLWKSVKDVLTVEVPHEWEIQKRDAGIGEVVFITSLERMDQLLSMWVFSIEEGREVDDLTYDGWVKDSSAILEERKDCKSLKVDGKELTCIAGLAEGQERLMYYVEISDKNFVGLSMPFLESDHQMFEIIRSIDFEPSKENLEKAIRIL